MNTQEFINRASLIHNNKYNYSFSEFKGTKEKLIISCPIHGNFQQLPCHHLRKAGCKKCATEVTKNKTTWDKEKFINKANQVHNNKYNYDKVIYKNNITKIIIICPIHGEFLMKPDSHNQGHGCYHCTGKIKRTTTQAIDELNLIHNNYYDYSKTDFIGFDKLIHIICPIHGLFEQKFISHLKGHGCAKCNLSIGEKLIFNFLNKNGIEFKQEYKFNNCRSNKNRMLKFDFWLPNYNTCIEFDGKQHFEENKFFGHSSFQTIQENDKIKDQYCLNNNINLLRIKYTELNQIENILSQLINII